MGGTEKEEQAALKSAVTALEGRPDPGKSKGNVAKIGRLLCIIVSGFNWC